MRKAFILFLSLVLLLGVAPAAFAASSEATYAAESLHDLGLFQGTGTTADGTPIYDLDRKPTRNEAVTMLVRLLGKEEEAMTGTWDIPFTDVANWAKPYVGYAYANGLTKGTGATTFGGESLVTASQYITFVLRALGYESEVDFQWDKAWELSDQIGATLGEYDASSVFLRGDVAKASLRSLEVAQKGKTETLAQKLIADEVFTAEQYAAAEVFMMPSAFGDRALHEYLVSLGPISVDLGPSRPDRERFFHDVYYYDMKTYTGNPNLADDITAAVKGKYVFDWIYTTDGIPHQMDPESDLVRVETINRNNVREIIIAIFKDGLYYSKSYVIKDEPFALTAYGDKELHEYLKSLNPSDIVYGPLRNNGFDTYWYDMQTYTGNPNLEDEINEAINSKFDIYWVDTWNPQPHEMDPESDLVRVETSDYNDVVRLIIVTRFKDGLYSGKQYTILKDGN